MTASSDAEPAAEERKTVGTEYVVLRRGTHDASPPVVETHWAEIGRGVFSGAQAAILGIAGENDGEYVAAPSRSWRPRVVRVKKTTKVTIE